ncbi:MAG TPA: sigma-54 dependent transcriptional regulator [Polyangiaceae bacterium]|jgi:DNA-binding NtrC family response regulator|nr:sigma-54 dependent transcriptional regulator [Polyangiaceae bacterium]
MTTTPPPAPRGERLATVAATVLVVDDEPNIRRTLALVLTGAGYGVVEAGTAGRALEILENADKPVDIVILDIKLPDESGLVALQKLRRDHPADELPVIVISGHATVDDAVQAIRLGATDFFEKPLNRERVLVSVHNCIRSARLGRTVEQMRAEAEHRYQMLGTSDAMKRLYNEIDKVAPTRATVLITGPSGTGKELVSRAIHRLSPRADAPFIRVNCAAIPRELIESELFGHERGSFTGAQTRKRGFFEQAHGGTLFLDEIGDMDLSAQAKVLRALQNGEVIRVGSETALLVDVRVLAATNKDLAREVQEGRFREDLYFRLEVFPISVPPLSQRRTDIELLARSFVEAFCLENGFSKKKIEQQVFTVLASRAWPGNVRELKNVVERAAILSSDVITVADLPEDPHISPFDEEVEPSPDAPSVPPAGERKTLRQVRDDAERAYIVQTLNETDWNVSKAAVALGVERTNLHKKVRAYKIRRDERS